MYNFLKHGEILAPILYRINEKIKPIYSKINDIEEENQYRLLKSFQNHRVSESYLQGTTGYGYDDYGRDVLESLFAEVFGAEAGLVRQQIISGTHAITTALFGVLRPDDELMYITGKPYDTLEEVIGIRGESKSSLKSFGISYQEIPLKQGEIDIKGVLNRMSEKTKVVAIQRSCGYANRPSFHVDTIEKTISLIKNTYPNVIVFIDNCYGEFVETREPTHVGADLMAGSLIKNPGGGLAKAGGYIVGKTDLIDQCAERLTAPGLGKEVGPSLNSLHEMYQGFFLAPHVTSEALKGAIFTSALLSELGMETTPAFDAARTDLIQSVNFKSEDRMISFCQSIQSASPINSHVLPEPALLPGYRDKVIMAAGTFVQGASIELSADGPVREPYTVFVQGGLTLSHVKIAILSAIDNLIEKGLISMTDVY